jgi:pilus assembly protein CpaB
MFRRRWPLASKALLVLALACGGLAFLLVRGYETRLEALRPMVGRQVPVVFVTRDVSRGTVLDDSVLDSREIPEAFVPPGVVTRPEAVAGRVLTSEIAAGEVLTASRLAAPRAGPIAALVPPGLRAVVVAATVPDGSIRPGDLVDVLATYGGGRPHTETVAESVEVLRVLAPDDAVSGSGKDPDLVLLVAPDVAEHVAYARTFAQLFVAILGPAVSPGTTG